MYQDFTTINEKVRRTPMRYSEAKVGRIFVVKLEHGDKIPDAIERFAQEQQIASAVVQFLGGADTGSKVIVGPEDGQARKPRPMMTELLGTSEAFGIGTILMNEDHMPKLHMHASFGRGRETLTGCSREGINVWQIGEVIVMELLDHQASRKLDLETGFELLDV
jgi:predicted DNA-binding protein with PD1-like motif